MEFTIIHSMYRYPIIPPIDLWYGGDTFNVYYYYGYWLFSSAGILLRIPPQILFNLILPTIYALTAVNVYGIGKLLLKKFSIIPLFIFILPNIALIYYLIRGFSIVQSYQESILLIPGTRNEYLLASTLIGDIHPHVISFFIQTLLLLLLIDVYKNWNIWSLKIRFLYASFISIALGSLIPLNTWAIFLFGPLTVITGFLIIYQRIDTHKSNFFIQLYKNNVTPILLFIIVIPFFSVLIYLPYYLHNDAQTLIPEWVNSPSPVSAFLLMWGFMILITFFVYRKEIKKYPYFFLLLIPGLLSGYGAATLCLLCIIYAVIRRKDYLDLLICMGYLLIFIGEFFYLNDNLISFNYRFNTIFKIYSMIWILIGITNFIYLGKEFENNKWTIDVEKIVPTTLSIILIIGVILIIPFTSTIWGISDTPGLRGDSFLSISAPDDYKAIQFLRNLTGNYCLIETSDFYDDDIYYGKISTFSGIPSIIGKHLHEILWRSHSEGDEKINQKIISVRLIYEKPELTVPLMDLNNANLLYVGPLEKTHYKVNLPQLGLEEIYSTNNVTIYKRTSDTSSFPENWNGSVLITFPDLKILNEKISDRFQKFTF